MDRAERTPVPVTMARRTSGASRSRCYWPSSPPASRKPRQIAPPTAERLSVFDRGIVSHYGHAFAGKRTASGEPFDPDALRWRIARCRSGRASASPTSRTSAAWKSWSTTADLLRPGPHRRPVARLGPPNRHGHGWHRRRRAADRGAAAEQACDCRLAADGGIYTAWFRATAWVAETTSNSLIQWALRESVCILLYSVRNPAPGDPGGWVWGSPEPKLQSSFSNSPRCAAGRFRARGVELSGRFRGGGPRGQRSRPVRPCLAPALQ